MTKHWETYVQLSASTVQTKEPDFEPPRGLSDEEEMLRYAADRHLTIDQLQEMHDQGLILG